MLKLTKPEWYMFAKELETMPLYLPTCGEEGCLHLVEMVARGYKEQVPLFQNLESLRSHTRDDRSYRTVSFLDLVKQAREEKRMSFALFHSTEMDSYIPLAEEDILYLERLLIVRQALPVT